MRERVVHRDRWFCELCGREQDVIVYGNEVIRDPDPTFVQEVLQSARHDHWTKLHRVCAVCGRLVVSGELALAINDGGITIHKDYTHHYGTRVKPSDSSFCLFVHMDCVQ